jgi:hypothetical protein
VNVGGIRANDGVKRFGSCLQGQHVGGSSQVNEKNLDSVTEMLPETIHRGNGVGILAIGHGMALIGVCHGVHDIRMHTGMVVACQSSPNVTTHANLSSFNLIREKRDGFIPFMTDGQPPAARFESGRPAQPCLDGAFAMTGPTAPPTGVT